MATSDKYAIDMPTREQMARDILELSRAAKREPKDLLWTSHKFISGCDQNGVKK